MRRAGLARWRQTDASRPTIYAANARYQRSEKGRIAHRNGTARYRTPTRISWEAMWSRCTKPKAAGYENYGGRGITVCGRWRSFDNFLADMGERPEGKTLDRIQNDWHYDPSNCRWATATEQSRNRRWCKRAAA